MATIPIIGKVTIGGTAKNISGGYVNVNGVWKSAWKVVYTWKKYSVTQSTAYTAVKSSTTIVYDGGAVSTKCMSSASYTFDSGTGVYTLTNPSSVTFKNLSVSAPYLMLGDAVTGTEMWQFVSGSGNIGYRLTYYPWTSSQTTTQAKGDFIADITSENESAYPDNGIHTDGYWYVKQ